MDSWEKTRLELFSDAVFAIAITLLILDLKVPKPESLGGATLLSALAHQWPSFLAFATSFATILMIWVNHHYLFNWIEKASRQFVLLNGLLLFLTTFVPFPTALAAEYIGHDGEKTAILIYVGLFLSISLVFYSLWTYLTRHPSLLKPDKNLKKLKAMRPLYIWGPPFYLGVLLIALWASAWVGVLLCLGLVLIPQSHE